MPVACMQCICTPLAHAPQSGRQTLRGVNCAARMEGMMSPEELDILMQQRDKVGANLAVLTS